MKVWTDEEKLYINENFRYEPNTGLVYYKKNNNRGQPRKMDKPVGSYEGTGYLQVPFVLYKYQWKIQAHRLAWYLYYGEVPSDLIDHIDHNKINNKIDNLRETNHSKNARHSSIKKAKLKKRAEGNCIGVFKKRNIGCSKKPYQVMHNIDGKNISLGYYTTMVEAAKARDVYAIEKYGSNCGPTNKDIGIY